jgi:hypothetical protein
MRSHGLKKEEFEFGSRGSFAFFFSTHTYVSVEVITTAFKQAAVGVEPLKVSAYRSRFRLNL